MAVWFFAMQALAQESYSLSQNRFTFAMQPFQWFNYGLRFDFETRLDDGPGWLQFGPSLYINSDDDIDNPNYYYDGNSYHYMSRWNYGGLHEPFSKLRGGGLDVNYKRFINSERSFYFASGLSFTHFNIEYWGRGWKDYIEDGLQYHAYAMDYRTQKINRLGINTFFGYQMPTNDAFLFDIFWGLAYRQSFSDENKPSFNESMISYGYTGAVFLVGVRIGFGIK
jgi:hypothetical protein